jgi:hypothetical protein
MFPQFSPALPPIYLSTHVSVGDDPDANIQCAARQFARYLGSSDIITKDGVREAVWQCGAASVKLIAWPAEAWFESRRNFGSNPARQRDPRLDSACSVAVWTGWWPTLTIQEQVWLDGFVPMHTDAGWLTTPSNSMRLEYFYGGAHLE